MATAEAKLVVGDNNFLGCGCQMSPRVSIKIGHNCQLAAGCQLVDFNHGIVIGDGPMATQTCIEEAIILEDDVWLATGVIVLKGVTIGSGSIVGAGSVVTKSIPPYEIWAGAPARKIGERR